MIDPAPRLAPRSVVAIADLELLRVARAELDDPSAPAGLSVGTRLRGLARFAGRRSDGDVLGPSVSVTEHRSR
jgi:hypothetical protein